METETYQQIRRFIRNFNGLSIYCLDTLKQQFPEINPNALNSIVNLEYQRRMKTNHIKSQANINKYWNVYLSAVKSNEPPGIIVKMSSQFDICPCLIAKVILQKYFEEQGESERGPIYVNEYLRDTSLIPDTNLSYEVFLCTLYDNLYSPLSETIKHSQGQQYEIRLHNEVKRLGLAFYDEEHLRKYGYDKTPDVKLDVPVAINGFIINWIESKALFGDEQIHQEYTKSQYLSYWNRFGPGLVIYWFGCVQSVRDTIDNRFTVRVDFPSKVTELTVS